MDQWRMDGNVDVDYSIGYVYFDFSFRMIWLLLQIYSHFIKSNEKSTANDTAPLLLSQLNFCFSFFSIFN